MIYKFRIAYFFLCDIMRKTDYKEYDMEPKDYELVRIEGEYAYLRDLSGACTEDVFIALSLLPFGADVGTKLHYEMFEYSIL